MKEIALCRDDQTLLCDFPSVRHVEIRKREAGIWRASRQLPWQLGIGSPAALRDGLRALATELAGCRILLCTKISGIAYQELTKAGIALFEAKELSDGLLDDILQDVQNRSMPPAPCQDAPKTPVSPKGDGHYSFDLIAAQLADPELSSKRALRGFLENQDFLSLELVCDHLPPWAEEVLARRSLYHSIQPRPQGGLHIRITNAPQ